MAFHYALLLATVLTGLGLYWVASDAPTSSLQHFLLGTVAFMLILSYHHNTLILVVCSQPYDRCKGQWVPRVLSKTASHKRVLMDTGCDNPDGGTLSSVISVYVFSEGCVGCLTRATETILRPVQPRGVLLRHSFP